VVFTTPEAAEAARATPIWVKALDPEASLYSKIFSLRVQGANPREVEGFLGAKAAIGAENQVKIFKILASTPQEAVTEGCATPAWNIPGWNDQRRGGHVIGSWIEKPGGL